MQTVSTICLDIAKSVFQVPNDAGEVVIRSQLKRRYVLAFFQKLAPCLVGVEACASSHHWSRELKALGHTVRLMPPAYVKPYVKRQKNDATDAEAISEAVRRPTVLPLLNRYSRVPVCGLIAYYNGEIRQDESRISRTMMTVLRRSLLIGGFINTGFVADHYQSFLKELIPLVASGKIRYREDITEGLASAP